jgi:hypothetical protein
MQLAFRELLNYQGEKMNIFKTDLSFEQLMLVANKYQEMYFVYNFEGDETEIIQCAKESSYFDVAEIAYDLRMSIQVDEECDNDCAALFRRAAEVLERISFLRENWHELVL